ncbi:MAG TPA: hypothetical protein VKR06_37105 [Ktedonosporobacter sp.]|nr:hypothetical protein [Ktedonosporobacter sp.]
MHRKLYPRNRHEGGVAIQPPSIQTTRELITKLGQLQAQLQHLPRPSDADYQLALQFTKRFAGEVQQDLEQLIQPPLSTKDEVHTWFYRFYRMIFF